MINFSLDELVRLYKEEKTSRDLVEISEDFYQSVAKHISQLTSEIKRAGSPVRELLHEELRNVVFMVQEIHLTRVFKAMNKMVQGYPPAPLIDRERYAYSEIRQSLEKLQADLVQRAISGKVEVAAPPNITNVLLLMLADIEKIVGADMKSYGPFVKGEIASLPTANAEIIARHGMARKIVVKV